MHKIGGTIKWLVVVFSATILVTVGIDAADHYGNLKETIVGKIIFNSKEGPCPSDMVFVPTEEKGFCFDKYESAAGEKCSYINPSSQLETRANLDDSNCQPVSQAGLIPWRFISQTQAMEACAKAGKRLPSGAEWYLASLGTPDLQSDWRSDDCQVANNWPSQPGLVGSGAKCVSSVGAFDMIGNAWEWVKEEIKDGKINNVDLPDEGYVKAVDIKGWPTETAENPDPNFNNDYFWIKKNETRAMARGGYWDNKGDAGKYAIYLDAPSSFVGAGIGFRCAK